MSTQTQNQAQNATFTDKVSETLLIPLYFRALEQERSESGKSAILRDTHAKSLIERIPYDYSKLDSGRFSRIGCCVRAAYFDSKVAAFIAQNDNVVVICGGCGLDTRYERLKSQNIAHFDNAMFYEIDLPEVIALRKTLLTESPKDIYMATSLLENDYLQTIIAAHPHSPIIVVIEGVLMYFSNDEIKQIFSHLQILGECTNQIWIDFTGTMFSKSRVSHDTIRHFDVKFHSGFDDENAVIALANEVGTELECIDVSLYMRHHFFRWGIFGMLAGSLPRKIQKRFSFMAGFVIKNARNSNK